MKHSNQRVLLLYSGYLSANDSDTLYRDPIENSIGSIHFDIAPLRTNGKKKIPASEMREWADIASNTLSSYDYVLIADADWFKILTKNTKADTTIGMAQNSPNFTSKVFYVPNPYLYSINREKFLDTLSRTIIGLEKDMQGKSTLIEPDIHSESYPESLVDIANKLTELLNYPMLYCDIEARSLKVTEAGIYTIAFAWDKHNGVAFKVDSHSVPNEVRKLLANFFRNYKGKLVFHKANYDVSVLIYSLYQQDLTNIQGQLEGLDIFFRDNRLDDTLVITYLATNSCGGNSLGLKELAQPYAGDWAVEVSDVTKVPINDLLKYNLIDCLSTAYVYETYYPKMVIEEQEKLYKEFMLPTLRMNIRCQLNGLPIDLEKVKELKQSLEDEKSTLITNLTNTQTVKNAEYLIAENLTNKRNSKLKTKVTTIEDNKRPINYNSNNDLIILIHSVMGLPVLDTTPSGQSALGKDILRDLVNHTTNQEYINILNWIADLKDVEKILTAFIPAFEEAPQCGTGNRLMGYFNLAGTVSGRLSSSNINLNVTMLQRASY